MPRNFVPRDGGLTSINCTAPTKIAVTLTSLANAQPLNESGEASVPIACMVSAKALATGVTVSKAVAPLTLKLVNQIVLPETTFAVATMKVAD